MHNFKYNNAQHDRERKIELYTKILDIVGDSSMALIGLVEGEDMCRLVNNSEYGRYAERLAVLCKENIGTMRLYLPNEIYSEIIRFRSTVYALSKDETKISSTDTREDVMTKIGKTKLVEMQEEAHQIIINIQRDIEKGRIDIDISFLENAEMKELRKTFHCSEEENP